MKKGPIIGILVIAIAIAAIIATYGNADAYADFAVAKASGKELHVVGNLILAEPLVYEPLTDPNYFSFYMTDNSGQACKVEFMGAKPQDFERSEQIVLTGKMQGDVFKANKILMKCPSKYNDSVPAEFKSTALVEAL